MSDPKAIRLVDYAQRLVNQRAPFDALYQDIAERVIPRKAKFNMRGRAQLNTSKGEKNTTKIFDAAPALALERFASSAHSLVVPRNQVWHKLRADDERLNKSIRVQRFFEELTDILFANRYASNFDHQVQECLVDLGAFGTMCMYVGDEAGLYYRNVPIWQAYFAEGIDGTIDTIIYYHVLTARNAVKEFGKEKLPPEIINAAERSPETEFEFLCVTMPRDDYDVTRADAKGKKYAQWTICLANNEIVEDKGYKQFPYAVGRYSSVPNEIYGRGPVELVLPDVKMLYAMMKTTVQAAELATLPPLLAHQDGILDGVRLTPAAVNYGGVDDNGRQRVIPLQTGGKVELGLDMMEQKRLVISDALWGKMFQVLLENPQMTATQAMLIAQQQGALLAPTASRIEAEFLATVIARELEILSDARRLPPPPPELVEAGLAYKTEYDSPLSRARKAEKGVAILRTFEQLAPVAQASGDPATVFGRIDFNETTKELADANGMPADCLLTDEEMDAAMKQKQQQLQLQQILQAAPVAADAAKSLAQAQAVSASSPNQTVVPA